MALGGMLRLLLLVAIALTCAHAALAQHLIGNLVSPAGDAWSAAYAYHAGNKLFVADSTNARLRVYDATTLAPLPDVSLAAYLPDQPRRMAGHEASARLYVVVDGGFATSASRIVVVDTAAPAVLGSLDDLGYSLGVDVDAGRALLYVYGLGPLPAFTWQLRNVTIPGGTVAGPLDVEALMGQGIIRYAGHNAATAELAFTNLNYDRFVVASGTALTGQMYALPNSRGWTGTWNPALNRLYITTITWGGYFSYDRDDGAAGLTTCVNDGTELFYSAATQRVYSGAEVDGWTTVIEGAGDTCENVTVGVGRPDAGFVETKKHAYFAGSPGVNVLDENTRASIKTFPTCAPCGGGGTVDSAVAVDQAGERVYALIYCNTSEGEGSCIVAIGEALFADGFE